MLLDGSMRRAKLGDFGIARDKPSGGTMTLTQLPIPWTAPEALAWCGHIVYHCSHLPQRHSPVYTSASDRYSFGMLLYELVTRTIPFHGEPLHFLATLILQNSRPQFPPQPLHSLEDYDVWKALITQLWDQSPDKRPPLSNIVMQLVPRQRTEGGIPMHLRGARDSSNNALLYLPPPAAAYAPIQADAIIVCSHQLYVFSLFPDH